MTLARKPLPGRWPILWLLLAVRVAMGYQFQAAAGAGPWLVEEFKIDYATLGSLIGFYVLPGIVAAVPGGYVARFVGEKRLLLFGLALMTAGGVLSGVAGDFELVFAGRAISACGVVFLFVVMTKAVGDWFEGGERFFAMALFLNGWPIGMGIALAAQPALGAFASWHWIFLTSAALCAAGFGGMLAIFRRPPQVADAEAAAGSARLSRRAAVLVTVAGLAWGTVNGGHIAVVSFAPSFLAARGIAVVDAGIIVSVNMWAAVAGVIAGGWITARVRRPVAVVACGLLVGALAGLLFVDGTDFALWLVVAGFFSALGAGVQVTLPLEALDPRVRAFGLGIFYMWWYSGFSLLPWAAGWTRDVTGNPAAPIYFGIAMVALTAPLLLLFRALQFRWRAAEARLAASAPLR
jgi:predicted MFS family arabinose efflux permease